MAIACFIRYQIDPFQREAFARYAEARAEIIPRCGGELIGYFLPYEGTNDVAWGVVGFQSWIAKIAEGKMFAVQILAAHSPAGSPTVRLSPCALPASSAPNTPVHC